MNFACYKMLWVYGTKSQVAYPIYYMAFIGKHMNWALYSNDNR